MGLKKKCTKCAETKSIALFYKQKKGLLGRTAECKDCRKKRTQKWTDENREKKNFTARKNYIPGKRAKYNEIWRKENPEYFKQYYKQNKKIRLECNKRFWKNHPERYKQFCIYQNARNKGILINPNQCQLCGTKEMKIQAHHFDYSKPLQVTWICLECHKEIHKRKKFTKVKNGQTNQQS